MDLLFHMLIPLMLLLIAGVDRRKALMLAPVAIIPDLDVLFAAHRVYLHTIFIPTAAVTICLLLYELKRRDLLNFSVPTQGMFLATTYYCSHLLLDFFAGPVAILWPITNLGYGLNVGIIVNQQSIVPTIQPYLAVRMKQIPVPNLVTNVAAATPESIMTAILLLVIMLLIWYKKGISRLSQNRDRLSKAEVELAMYKKIFRRMLIDSGLSLSQQRFQFFVEMGGCSTEAAM